MDNTHLIHLTESLTENSPNSEFPFKRVRILTLNTFLRPPLIKNNKSDYKNARVNFMIDNIFPNYDIICLQEVFGALNTRKGKIIKEAIKLGFEYFSYSPYPGFWSQQMIDGGLVILSRFPITEHNFQGFQNGVVPDLFSLKGILYCKIEIHGEPLHLFTTHLQASYPTTSQSEFQNYRQVRRHQMQMMKEFIRANSHDKELILLLGDMNVDAKEKLKKAPFEDIECQDDYEALTEAISDGDLKNLVDVGRSKYGYSPSTYGVLLPNGEAEETVLTNKKENKRDTAIDYIFAMNLKDSVILM